MMRLIVAAIVAAQAVTPPQTTVRSGVEVVELDVSVMRGGAPVAGLTDKLASNDLCDRDRDVLAVQIEGEEILAVHHRFPMGHDLIPLV